MSTEPVSQGEPRGDSFEAVRRRRGRPRRPSSPVSPSDHTGGGKNREQLARPAGGAPVNEESSDLPVLTLAVVDDEQDLAEAVDAVIQADPVARERAAEIVEAMRGLQNAADPGVWKLVLDVEARKNERVSDLTLVLVRWAFNDGVRVGGGQR